ncbi:polymer-forming cytoskeletal protein [Serratia sp. JSRIV004]|uniref:bactofilin family protein n=1 Tax=Serratia sp. JSRIV004 TaxID=2831895 RepID=UPI001CC19EA1|nr:polymer-forming cytoskeletal protein [Serratia sp. JSRIV004]CAI1129759.1 Polymer-forming cytoskeletal [Serratia fonticola]CAI1134551.1 Polymer-forming cytoskeletal [Serratia fonticola]
MRNYNLLWCIWGLWTLSIVLWLTGISFTGIYIKRALLAALVLALLATLAFIYKITRTNQMLSFNKKNKAVNEEKAQELIDQPVPQPVAHSEPNTLPEVADAIKPIRAKKDTFISNGALFTGVIEGDGNIIVEGRVEGNIICSHMVRIETSGHVKGEIRAQQIMINGPVEGRCFADSLSIQPKGSMRGDIFADEISIEKGGLFIGQSQLMQKTPPQAQPSQAKVTALKKVEPEQQEQPTPQPSKHAN